jgi:hypothetical protein
MANLNDLPTNPGLTPDEFEVWQKDFKSTEAKSIREQILEAVTKLTSIPLAENKGVLQNSSVDKTKVSATDAVVTPIEDEQEVEHGLCLYRNQRMAFVAKPCDDETYESFIQHTIKGTEHGDPAIVKGCGDMVRALAYVGIEAYNNGYRDANEQAAEHCDGIATRSAQFMERNQHRLDEKSKQILEDFIKVMDELVAHFDSK